MSIMATKGIRVPRPFCFRTIDGKPAASVFKPTGIPMPELEVVVMTLDEFEAGDNHRKGRQRDHGHCVRSIGGGVVAAVR